MDASFIALNRMVEERMEEDPSYREKIEASGKFQLLHGRGLTDDQLFEKLATYGARIERETFGELCPRFVSAEEMSKWAFEEWDLSFPSESEEFWIWIAFTVFWERHFPDIVNFEMIDDRMQEGYDAMTDGDLRGGCEIWVPLLAEISKMMDRLATETVEEFDKRFRGTQCVFNWAQDLDESLWNLGDSDFLRERISLGEWLQPKLSQGDRLTCENCRRSVAETHFELDDTQRTDDLFGKWLTEDPAWGWGWIGWSDCYQSIRSSHQDLERAEKILQEGIDVQNLRDREDVLDRLRTLHRVMGKETPQSVSATAQGTKLAGTKTGKVGRNMPCPCGSGKKYKKCCGR